MHIQSILKLHLMILLVYTRPKGLDTARKNQEIDDDDKEDDVITKVRQEAFKLSVVCHLNTVYVSHLMSSNPTSHLMSSLMSPLISYLISFLNLHLILSLISPYPISFYLMWHMTGARRCGRMGIRRGQRRWTVSTWRPQGIVLRGQQQQERTTSTYEGMSLS